MKFWSFSRIERLTSFVLCMELYFSTRLTACSALAASPAVLIAGCFLFDDLTAGGVTDSQCPGVVFCDLRMAATVVFGRCFPLFCSTMMVRLWAPAWLALDRLMLPFV